MIDKIALTLLIIGGINWGLVGIFQFDLVAFLCGGQSGVISRIIYIIVCLCAIWCITLLFKDTQNAKSITDINFSNGCVLMIGNEANGLTEEAKKVADYNITIRMSGLAESLNASVAAAISMWEMMK